MSSTLYLVQARRPHGRYHTLTFHADLDAAVWSMRQHDVPWDPWASSTLRIIDWSGRVVARAVPKRGAK